MLSTLRADCLSLRDLYICVICESIRLALCNPGVLREADEHSNLNNLAGNHIHFTLGVRGTRPVHEWRKLMSGEAIKPHLVWVGTSRGIIATGIGGSHATDRATRIGLYVPTKQKGGGGLLHSSTQVTDTDRALARAEA